MLHSHMVATCNSEKGIPHTFHQAGVHWTMSSSPSSRCTLNNELITTSPPVNAVPTPSHPIHTTPHISNAQVHKLCTSQQHWNWRFLHGNRDIKCFFIFYSPYAAWSCRMCPTEIQHRMGSPQRAFHTSTLPATTNRTHIHILLFHLPWPVDRGEQRLSTPTWTYTSNTHITHYMYMAVVSSEKGLNTAFNECTTNYNLCPAQHLPAESLVICSLECPLQWYRSPCHWRPCANRSQNQPA